MIESRRPVVSLMKLAVDTATVTILMSNGIRARCISWKVRELITVVSVRGAVICLTRALLALRFSWIMMDICFSTVLRLSSNFENILF